MTIYILEKCKEGDSCFILIQLAYLGHTQSKWILEKTRDYLHLNNMLTGVAAAITDEDSYWNKLTYP